MYNNIIITELLITVGHRSISVNIAYMSDHSCNRLDIMSRHIPTSYMWAWHAIAMTQYKIGHFSPMLEALPFYGGVMVTQASNVAFS